MAILESEKELEDFIVSETETSKNDTNPLTDETIQYCFRQVSIGTYGIADIIFCDIYYDEEDDAPYLYIRIIEIKKDVIDLSAIAQISRYKRGLEQCLEEICFYGRTKVEGILVGSGYNQNDGSCFLVDSIDWLDCYHYTLSLTEGIKFERNNGWGIPDAGFSSLDEILKPINEKFLCENEKYKANLKNRLAAQ